MNLGNSFPNGLLVHNICEIIGSDPPNDVVRGDVAVNAAEAVVCSGSVGQGKFRGSCGGGKEVILDRGEPSDGGFEVLVLRHSISETDSEDDSLLYIQSHSTLVALVVALCDKNEIR